MHPISRRHLLRAAGAGALVLPLPVPAASAVTPADVPPHQWIDAGHFTPVHDPSASGRRRYLNDHTLVRSDGRWHLFSIVGDSAAPGEAPNSEAEVSFAHASAPDLYGTWTTHPDALTVDPTYYGEQHLWAPHVIEAEGTYWMFYAAGGRDGAAINLATSTDLFTWTRLPSGPLFRGPAARDPMVVRIGAEWVMYYTDLSATDGRHLVCWRRSADLLRWSAPGIAFADDSTAATGVSVTESPYVVARNGWFYLFIGPRGGYDGTDVLASRDPFRFTLDGYAGHVPGHAVEPITDTRNWYASAAGWFRHGLSLAPLRWQDTPPVRQSPDNPVAAPDVHGRLTVFALDAADRSMLRRMQLDPDSDTWSDWEPFGGPAGAVPTLGRNTNGRLEVFSLAPGGLNLHHRVQRPDGGWYDWEEFGGPAGAAPAVARNADGRLEVFALSPGGTLIARRRQFSPGALVWDAWDAGFGGPAGAPPVVGVNADGRLEVFALTRGGTAILHRWQETPGGAWSPWNSFGTAAAAAPRVTRDGSGRLTVAAIAPSGVAAFHRRQSVPSGGWDDWQPLFGWSSAAPLLVPSADGRLEGFALSPGGERLTHRWQLSPGGTWAPGEDITEPGVVLPATPTAAADATGRLHLFAVASDGRVRTRVQKRAGGDWHPWAAFGTRAIAP
ncbi:family 43 glycosylhydrolase [Streptomyces sp. NBC_00846]|uniref:family 43 glycosylhydrolase n=1 Tax=Streptomyces sp. NBC_00846 TaxID=2975849 RepID=UPI00386609A2|nr:family 43 glycosylhydrolase [Streptomyces sp. NBC_00846]